MGYLLLTQAPGLRQTDFNHSATENGGVTPPTRAKQPDGLSGQSHVRKNIIIPDVMCTSS